MSFFLRMGTTALALLTLSACSTIYRPGGWVAYDFTERYAIPHTMKSNDVPMACSMVGSMLPVLMAFTEIAYTPDKDAIVMNMLMGSCADAKAQEHVLDYARAMKAQNISAAQDARILEKHAFALTAARQYASYQHMVAQFGEPGEKCPSLSRDEELYWVLGNLAGMQAVLSDLKAQSVVNVPKDIAMKSVRGMQCVDNVRWWGLPEALQAGIWIMMPDAAPKEVDVWAKMEHAGQIATASGVRLAHAIEVIIADGAGHNERLRAAIKRHGDSLKLKASDPKYRLIDLLATAHVQAVSDRLWTENTGARTPFGSLGSFWDDAAKPTNTINIDDLLED
ncbi:MAG: hypothetical protein RL217_958 [Pseudomonadota bacterium]|jgi:hypothetical protein